MGGVSSQTAAASEVTEVTSSNHEPTNLTPLSPHRLPGTGSARTPKHLPPPPQKKLPLTARRKLDLPHVTHMPSTLRQENQAPTVAAQSVDRKAAENGKSLSARVGRHFSRGIAELRTPDFWRDVACETLSTFLMLSVQSVVPLGWGRPGVKGSALQGTLAMTCVIVSLIEGLGHFGGTHMNPAVSIAMVIAGRMSIIRAVIYIIIQCLGAVAGSAFSYVMIPPEFRETLAATQLRPGLSVAQGLMCEIWVTSILIFTIHGSSNFNRRPVYVNSIIIGMAVLVGGLSGGELTGASMNPARSLGPAVVMNIWKHHWIYWVGPITGASLATVLYVHCFDRVGRQKARQRGESSSLPPFTINAACENDAFVHDEDVQSTF